MITREQELQMITLAAGNIHPVAVENCPDGGDDLDLVVAELFSDPGLKARLRLSSVNSINWCRVMVQAIHYFYGYFRACNTIGDPVVFSVPPGPSATCLPDIWPGPWGCRLPGLFVPTTSTTPFPRP